MTELLDMIIGLKSLKVILYQEPQKNQDKQPVDQPHQ